MSPKGRTRGTAPLCTLSLRSTPVRLRFRGPADPGVFYGAELRRTACAELGYWRWRLLMDSPGLKSIGPMPQTAFTTPVRALSIDLQKPPLSRQRKLWTDPFDYSHSRQLARNARAAGIGMIRYESVRDIQPAGCAAVLSHTAFAASSPTVSQAWTLSVSRQRVIWRLDSIFEAQSFEFVTQLWGAAGGEL
ncbi:MAG: hypothetical protein V7606_1502 [Burkholderiales bacterium]